MKEVSGIPNIRQEGFVYVLTNASFPGLVKIGMTTQKSVDARIRHMSTGSPTTFQIAYQARVKNPLLIEKKLHGRFDNNRISRDREWFSVSVEEVQKALWEFDSEVKRKDKIFSAIADYKKLLNSIENINKDILVWFTVALLVLTVTILFYVNTDEMYLWQAGVAALLVSFIPGVLFAESWVEKCVHPINRWRFRDQLSHKRKELNEKYGLGDVDIREMIPEYDAQQKAQVIKIFKSLLRERKKKAKFLK